MNDSSVQQFEEDFIDEEEDREVNPIGQKNSPIAPHDRVEVKTEERTYAAVGDSSYVS